MAGIEPTLGACKAPVLPLNDTTLTFLNNVKALCRTRTYIVGLEGRSSSIELRENSLIKRFGEVGLEPTRPFKINRF